MCYEEQIWQILRNSSKPLNIKTKFSFSNEQSEYFQLLENFLLVSCSTKVELKGILIMCELYVKNCEL